MRTSWLLLLFVGACTNNGHFNVSFECPVGSGHKSIDPPHTTICCPIEEDDGHDICYVFERDSLMRRESRLRSGERDGPLEWLHKNGFVAVHQKYCNGSICGDPIAFTPSGELAK